MSMPDNSPTPMLSPDQRAELDRRLDAYEANQDDVLTWDEVLERVRDRADRDHSG